MRHIFIRIGFAVAVASGLLLSLGAAAGAQTTPPMTLAQLKAATPVKPQVALLPGQSTLFPAYSFVEKELAQPWLTSAERSYLESVPIEVSNPSASEMVAEAPPSIKALMTDGDPVMYGACTYEWGAYWYHSYLGFSYNGTVVTNVASPNDYWETDPWLGIILTGRLWHQFEATGSKEVTYLDMGSWDYSQIATSYIWYYMHGSGHWTEVSIC